MHIYLGRWVIQKYELQEDSRQQTPLRSLFLAYFQQIAIGERCKYLHRKQVSSDGDEYLGATELARL